MTPNTTTDIVISTTAMITTGGKVREENTDSGAGVDHGWRIYLVDSVATSVKANAEADTINGKNTAMSIDIRSVSGLTQAEAEDILRRDGPNELPSARPRSFWEIAAGVVREPMFMLLIAGGIIYLLLGDLQEALLLLGFVFVVIGITLNQERKTENALQALRNLSSPRARVIRGGEEIRIPGREVVRGDMVIIAEGDRVPADGIILSSTNLSTDESLLTGESMPVSRWGSRPAVMTSHSCTPVPWLCRDRR